MVVNFLRFFFLTAGLKDIPEREFRFVLLPLDHLLPGADRVLDFDLR